MAAIDISSVTQRVVAGLQPDFEIVCFETAKQHARLVESEIELMLLATFAVAARFTNLRLFVGDIEQAEDAQLAITPQFAWSGYRIDFCCRYVRRPEKMFFIECDGHEFHERTKEQAERDRSKDRAIQAAGIPILRFTGREIWRSPAVVAVEIFKFMSFR